MTSKRIPLAKLLLVVLAVFLLMISMSTNTGERVPEATTPTTSNISQKNTQIITLEERIATDLLYKLPTEILFSTKLEQSNLNGNDKNPVENVEEPTQEVDNSAENITDIPKNEDSTTNLTTEETSDDEAVTSEPSKWQGEVLNKRNGVVQGPSGKETYYNLPMGGVIRIMRKLGYDYEYWIRDDGVKMFGPYVMCAANLEIRPKGTILETSLGTAIVCDTGSFAQKNRTQVDIAVNW